jgi:hypothetical protein
MDNGARLVNFATSKNFRVKDGQTHNQINHILVDKQWHSNVLDVRSPRAADCNTDHYLVVAKVRKRLAVNKLISHRIHLERFNHKKLTR